MLGLRGSDPQGSNFESCVWRAVSSHSSHNPQVWTFDEYFVGQKSQCVRYESRTLAWPTNRAYRVRFRTKSLRFVFVAVSRGCISCLDHVTGSRDCEITPAGSVVQSPLQFWHGILFLTKTTIVTGADPIFVISGQYPSASFLKKTT